MTGYGVRIIADEAMSQDVDWMYVKQSDGTLVLYLSVSASGCARTLAEAWAAYRSLEVPTLVPRQRDLRTLAVT